MDASELGSDFIGFSDPVSSSSDFVRQLKISKDDYNKFLEPLPGTSIDISAVVCIEDDRLVCYDRASKTLRLLGADFSEQNSIHVGLSCSAMTYMTTNEVALSAEGRVMTYKIAGNEFIKQDREWNIDGCINAMSFRSYKLAVFFTTRAPAGQLRIKLIDTQQYSSHLVQKTFHDIEDFHFNSFRVCLTDVGVVLCDLNNHVVCVSQSDGSIIWKKPLENPGTVLLVPRPSPFLLVISPRTGQVTALDINSGEPIGLTTEACLKGRSIVTIQTTRNKLVKIANQNNLCLIRQFSIEY